MPYDPRCPSGNSFYGYPGYPKTPPVCLPSSSSSVPGTAAAASGGGWGSAEVVAVFLGGVLLCLLFYVMFCLRTKRAAPDERPRSNQMAPVDGVVMVEAVVEAAMVSSYAIDSSADGDVCP